MARFLLDENVDTALLEVFRRRDHDAVAVAPALGSGLADADVLSIAQREERVLVTNDRDFGALVFGEGRSHAGVMFLRLRDADADTVVDAVEQGLAAVDGNPRAFIVVTASTIRVRKG